MGKHEARAACNDNLRCLIFDSKIPRMINSSGSTQWQPSLHVAIVPVDARLSHPFVH